MNPLQQHILKTPFAPSEPTISPSVRPTTGPWFACSGNAGEHFNIECKGSGNGDIQIATLHGPDRKVNAQLIAASPDLLAACDEAASLLRCIQCSPIMKRTLAQLEHVIAKATGATP